jgi:MFS family permease
LEYHEGVIEDPQVPEEASASRSTGRGLAALRHRDYALFWSGALLSNIGNWVQTTALLWVVKEMTGSNAWVAAVNMAAYLPVLLFVVFAGLLADSANRKRIVIVTVVVQMACAAALAVTAAAGVASLPVLLALVFVAGTAYTFSAPAAVSFLPDLVPPGEMMSALSLSTAQFNIGRVIGPALGAILLTVWSPAGAFTINAISFVFVLAAFIMVRPRERQVTRPLTDVRRQIADGFVFVLDHRWRLYSLLALGAATFFGFSCTVLFPSLAKDVLHGKASTYGLLMSMLGVGAAVGAPLVTRLSRRFAESSIIRAGTLGLGVFLVCLSLARSVWLAALIAPGIGCCFLMMCSAVNTSLQGRSERGMRGRMVSLYSLMWLGMFGVGGQFIGYLADAASVPTAFLIGGIACICVALLLALMPASIAGASIALGVEKSPVRAVAAAS